MLVGSETSSWMCGTSVERIYETIWRLIVFCSSNSHFKLNPTVETLKVSSVSCVIDTKRSVSQGIALDQLNFWQDCLIQSSELRVNQKPIYTNTGWGIQKKFQIKTFFSTIDVTQSQILDSKLFTNCKRYSNN